MELGMGRIFLTLFLFLSFSAVKAVEVHPEVQSCIKNSKIKTHDLPLITYQTKDYKKLLLLKGEDYHLAKKKLEERSHKFLRGFEYRDMKWPRDMEVRDTGDWSETGYNGHNYNGTHPAVVAYYSPEVYCWMLNDRKGDLPDGSMIIKEMYAPPAGRYEGIPLDDLFTGWWTVMIKDSRASADGWYWLSIFDSVDKIDNRDGKSKRTWTQKLSYEEPHIYPESGFGAYCIRCHVASEKESTFASLGNVVGPYIKYSDDRSWEKSLDTTPAPTRNNPGMDQFARLVQAKLQAANLKKKIIQNKAIKATFKNITVEEVHKLAFPSEFAGRAWSHGDSTSQWVTSDQCMGCHSGDNTPYGPNMFVKKPFFGDKGIDISPWGEWRTSLMGKRWSWERRFHCHTMWRENCSGSRARWVKSNASH